MMPTGLRRLLPNPSRIIIAAHDLAMVALAWYALNSMRFAVMEAPPVSPSLWSADILVVMIVQGIVFHTMGLYRGLWRFASVPDLVNILKASVVGIAAISMVLFFYNRLDLVPRSVLLLYPMMLTALVGMPRLLYRGWKDQTTSWRTGRSKRVLILGAGQSGEAIVRDMRREGSYQPVGFLDDAKRLQGGRIQGLQVLGRVRDVARIAPEVAADLLVIAMPSVSADSLRQVVQACEKTGLPFRRVPRLNDVLEGHVLPGQLKEVAIEDLLGREPVAPDWQAVRTWLGGRSALVTGAGGSIGSELCRQCARNGAVLIGLVEIDELALMTIQSELERDFPQVRCVPVLGNCGDKAVMAHALRLCKPSSVFHAAAYKQVPLLEGQLREALLNNVLATHTVIKTSCAAGVSSVVLISTDKAVNPVNVLGASKRLAEMVCQAAACDSATRMVTVRFGNVLDSAGSVVPLFREQIRRGGPVTVTDPEVTRFFMTIPEACQLILQAVAIGSKQAVYTLDMGEPVSIRLLAEQMIMLAGKEPGRDIAIAYTGLRPGEKMHETLYHEDEHYRPTAHPKILQAQPRDVIAAQVDSDIARIRQAVGNYDVGMMQTLIRTSVPEFNPEAADADNGHYDRHVANVVAFPARKARNV